MKVIIEGYEVEIKAKLADREDARYNKNDTMTILNQLNLWCYEASENYMRIGCNTLSEHAKMTSVTIYKLLDANGYFKDVDCYLADVE